MRRWSRVARFEVCIALIATTVSLFNAVIFRDLGFASSTCIALAWALSVIRREEEAR